MKKIIFVCHGNICRSPAAECVFNKLLKEQHLEDKFCCLSRALTTEEIGNDIYPPMKVSLNKFNIPYQLHQAQLITQEEIDECDILVYMDDENRYLIDNYYSCPKHKLVCLANYLNHEEISDPWYHRGFDGCLKEIMEACANFLKELNK